MTIREHDFPAEEPDAGRIRAAIRGEDRKISRKTGLYLLAVRPDIEDRLVVLQDVLENPDEPAGLRYDAARYLGRIDAPESVAVLERNLEIPDEDVRAGVLKSLGRIGGRESLERIEAVRGRPGARAAPAAGFAAVLIAHRLGVDGYRIPLPEEGQYLEVDERESRSLALRKAEEEEAEAASASLELEPVGFDVAWDQVYRVHCGPRMMLLLLNREVVAEPEKALGASRLAGVIGHWHPQETAYAPIHFILTDPSDPPGGVDIAVANPNGKRMFAGAGAVRDGSAEFSIRGVSGFGTLPVDIAGRLAGEGLELSRGRVGRRVARKRVALRDE